MPFSISDEVRIDVATRLSGGQLPKAISESLNIALKTVYRLKKSFVRDGENFIAAPTGKIARESINREQLLALAEIMNKNSKTTMKELREQAISSAIFANTESAPDQSTIYRRLRTMGYKWQKPRFSDPRAKRTRIQFERCCFKQAQQRGLESDGKILSMDESNFYYEQATRAWGSSYRPPVLEKPKGKIMRRSMFATIGYKSVGSQVKAFIHWLLVPPRKSWRPLEERIQSCEIDAAEKGPIKEKYNEAYVNALTTAGLKMELAALGIRATDTTCEAMREVLLRVGRTGTRLNELRARGRGRPDSGGALVPPTGNAYMVSEYLHQCLGTYMAGQDLWAGEKTECELSGDLGIRGCPDGGKRECKMNSREMTLMWDNAPSHLPTTTNRVSPFQKWTQDKLGLLGVLQTPPYSPWFNPVELFFSYVKRYVRKHAPPDVPSLLQRIREATTKITGEMIKNWFKKCGFTVGPEEPRAEDPNVGIVDRCSLPENARFDRKEHVVCVDEAGTVRREKKPRQTRWSKYDAEVSDLQNVSVVKRSGIPPRKRHVVDTCPLPDDEPTRWVGLSAEPAGLQHGSYSTLFQHDDNMAEIDRIVDQRTKPTGKEYLVRWKNRPATENEWLAADQIMGLSSLLQYFGGHSEQKVIQDHKEDASRPSLPYEPNRNPEVGDVVCLYPPKEAEDLIFVAQVREMSSTKMTVHWWGSKKIDGPWSPEFMSKKGKGHAGPYTGSIWKEAVLDVLSSFKGKKGKIEKKQLEEIIKLANEHKKKK